MTLSLALRMPRRQLRQFIDAEEMSLYRAKYLLDGGFGEDKEDRRAAHMIIAMLRDGKTTYQDVLNGLNPSMKKPETAKEKHERLKQIFGALAVLTTPKQRSQWASSEK